MTSHPHAPLPEPASLCGLRVGRVAPFGPDGAFSAIDKTSVQHPLRLSQDGLEGDEQADRRHHGGTDKAVHHYPAEHYAAWRSELPDIPPSRLQPGAFGENLSTLGLTEANVCIGDIFSVGSARLQVSQARQPCWKLNVRFGLSGMSKKIQDSGRTGWYYRVLESGEIAPQDKIQLLDRQYPDWPLARLLHYLYIDPLNAEALERMAALSALPDSWRALAQRRLETMQVEDWSRRLLVPQVP